MCALRDNVTRYLRARSRPVLVSCEESQRVEISLSRCLTPSPLVMCTCICPAHHLSGTLHLRLRSLCIRPQYICAYMTTKRPISISIAFITGNSSLEPLLEGLCAQIHVNLS